MTKKIRIALLFGGKSSEHSISVATASGVMSAIDRDKYDVIPIGITKTGIFVPFEGDPASLALSEGLKEIQFSGKTIRFQMDGSRELIIEDGESASLGIVDVVWPLLHGPFGEDGTIQGFFELAGIPYVGNGVLASAAAMDKEFSKALFKAAGIKSPDHVIIHARDLVNDPESVLEKVSSLKKFPVFVKPARAGSSVGISKVKDASGLEKAILDALSHDDKVIVEVGVVGRELELGILEGRADAPLRASVAGEIVVSGREFYDFEAKYLDADSAKLICPAELTDSELSEMQALANKAFRALGCSGLARVDFFLTEEGFVLSEINTMPGFTSISMFPRCFQASGLSYSELIDELISLALEK
jgi:D-alanine-D-alanine ligase